MGRTNPTYRDTLTAVEDEWSAFERALRARDTQAYERLWEHAHEYADAAGYCNPPDPMHAVYLSMLLGQQRELEHLRDRLSEFTETE